MNENKIKIFIAIFSILISILLGALLKSWQDNKSSRMRYLDYKYEFQNNLIGKPDGLDEKIQVYLNGVQIDNLNQVTIEIYNPTDKDYTNVPLIIDLYSAKGDTLKLIQQNVVGAENLTDFVELLDNIKPSKRKGAIKFGYNLKSVNRLGNKPIFSAKYLIIGQPDKFQINILQTGLDLTSFNFDHFENKYFWERELFWFVIICIIYFGFLIWLLRRGNKSRKKYDKKLEIFLNDTLQKMILGNQIKFDSIDLAKLFIQLKNEFNWKNLKKWERFITGRKSVDD